MLFVTHCTDKLITNGQPVMSYYRVGLYLCVTVHRKGKKGEKRGVMKEEQE